MECSDIAKIVFGAALGLAISIGKDWLTELRVRRCSKKLLKIELPIVQIAVDSFHGRNIMPTTELPTLRNLGAGDLIAFPDSLAAPVRQLQEALFRAEISRNIASKLLGNQNSPEFSVHSAVYTECMKSAKKALDEIRENL